MKSKLAKNLFDIKTVEYSLYSMLFCAAMLLLTDLMLAMPSISYSLGSTLTELFLTPLRVMYVSSLVITVLLLLGNHMNLHKK